jgi:SEC-C motif-containing protein
MYHHNPGTAPTAEILMRSRYSAFALKQFDYIITTQKLGETPETAADIAESNGATQWIKLEVLGSINGSEKDKTGQVTFCAQFKEGSNTGKLTETSNFERIDGQWYYTGGRHQIQGNTPHILPEEHKIGRNDPCHCGSGKKFKKCCA